MSSTAWGVIGAIVCAGGYQLIKYGVDQTAGYVFVGVVVAAYVVAHFVYKRRLTRLRGEVAAMPEEERTRLLQEIDPEIAEDLKKKDDKKIG